MSIPPDVQQRLDEKRHAVEAARRGVENATKRLEAAQSTLYEAEIKLAEWEEVVALLKAASPESGQASATPSTATPADVVGGVRKRGLSENWKKVMAEIVRAYPFEVPLKRVEQLCADAGITANPDTIRGQMHLYRTRRWLESPTPGKFVATAAGAAAAGLALPSGPPHPDEDSPENEAAADLQSAADVSHLI